MYTSQQWTFVTPDGEYYSAYIDVISVGRKGVMRLHVTHEKGTAITIEMENAGGLAAFTRKAVALIAKERNA